MIQNREQLLSMASMWVNEAKNDIRNQAIAFMNTMNVREEELAHVLGISRGELEQILRGNGEISLSTFAKILIATDNMIEIKPLSATPFGQETNFPHPQNVRSSHRQRPQRPMPRRIPFGGLMNASRPFGNMPITPSMRNAMDRGPQPMCSEGPMCSEQDTPLLLDTMSRSQLIDEIVKNGWSQEININSASRTQLIEFLAQKGRSVIEEISQQAAPYREPRMVEPNIEDIVPEELDTNLDMQYDFGMLEDEVSHEVEPLDEIHHGIRDVAPSPTPVLNEEIPQVRNPYEIVEGTPTEDTITRLTQALRNNPQLVEALRNIIC